MTSLRLPLLSALLLSLSPGCGGSPPADAALDGADAAPDPADAAPDATPGDAAPPDASPAMTSEREPNNGGSLEDTNPLPLDTVVAGAVGTPGDADVYRLATTAGRVYVLTLALPEGSMLRGHLTAFDDGRGGDRPGEDYIKIVTTPDGGGATRLELLAMGTGGYLVVVRDARNVGGGGGSVGGPGFSYTLRAEERPASEFSAPELVFPASVTDTLAAPGALRLYPFTARAGGETRVDLEHRGDLDARLMVFSPAENSWVARNDDRSADNTAPLLLAPLPAGPMLLVVENVAPAATGLGYAFTATMR